MQYFDGGAEGPAVICAAYGKVPVHAGRASQPGHGYASPRPALVERHGRHAEPVQHGTEQPRRQGVLAVSNASIRGILIRVRTALAELVAELITLTPQDQEMPDRVAADRAVQFVITGDHPTIHYGNRRSGDIVTHRSGDQYNFGDITGNVAAGSSDVTQNYSPGFDVTKVRQFADLVTEIAGLLNLEPGQQAELSAATSELHDAVEDPKADKGCMRRAVDAVMGYLKLAGGTALTNAAITAGNQAGSELDLAIRHVHL